MQYVQAIFENENVRTYVSENEQLIDLAAATVASYRPALIDHVFENLQDFVEEDDLAATYENIKTFIIAENLYLYEAVSDVLADTELTVEETVVFLEGARMDVFTTSIKNFGGKAADGAKKVWDTTGGRISRKTSELLDSGAKKLAERSLMKQAKSGTTTITPPKDFANLVTGKRRLIKGGLAASGLTAAGAAALGGASYLQDKKDQANLVKGATIAGGVAGVGGLAYGAKKYANRKK